MIQIKEDDIKIFHEDAYFCGDEISIHTTKQEELKQQILQDHLRAKEYDNMRLNIKLLQHERHEWEKDRQIVKRLEEHTKFDCACKGCGIIRKILEGKK